MTGSAWSAFCQASKVAAHILRKPLTFIIHCAECSLLALGRCQQYCLSDSDVYHPSVVAAVGRLYLSSSSRFSFPILKCATHLLTVSYEGALSPNIATY